MKIVLVTGGARSGKSSWAEDEARRLAGSNVTYIATGPASDAEMARRIERHRSARPEGWETIELPGGRPEPTAPLADRIGAAFARARHETMVLDCLTLLVSNAVLEAVGLDAPDPDLEEEALAAAESAVDGLLAAASSREGVLVVVTNEVGWGVVPPTRLGRWFRDAQGIANRRLARAADRVVLLVSGIPIELERP